uniref:Cytokinin riboside 5'-monophosphate phosphoribohydrolase n=1 Tax=Bionectria ochroleuca TaxID=29856 RepID=A0A0B7K0P2_BIOOC
MYINTLRGGASSGNDPAHIEAAKALAHALHRYGIELVYGGGTTGIMGAIASTLVELSGPNAVHGIIPAALARHEEEVTKECADPSRFGTRTVVRDMHTRKRLMVKSVLDGAAGSGFVALSGGYGTMEELLEVTTWYQLDIHGRNVCIFNVRGFYDGLLYWIRSIALSEPYASVDDLFRVRDLSTAAEYKDLRAHNFSPSSLKGLDFSLGDLVSSGRRPIFRAVFLLMNSGSVLSINVHHSTTDITGFGALLKIWASHCSLHSSQPVGFAADWLDRRALLPSNYVALDAAQINLPTLLHREAADGIKKSGGHDDPDHLETLVFKLSGDTLRSLKGEVTKHLDTDVVPWVSTSDVLFGLLWAAVTYAEDQEDPARRGTPGRATARQMRFPVNVRSRLRPPLPENYLGSAFVVALATVDNTDLLNIIVKDVEPSIAALARVATAIRKSILAINNKAVEEVVGFLAAQDDLAGLKLGQQATDVSIVSWADESVYELDWGQEIGRNAG